MFKNNYVVSSLIYMCLLNKMPLSVKKRIKEEYELFENVFKNIEIMFTLPSKLENIDRFVLMMILLEKYFNNRIFFLLDNRTISTANSIKIGCKVNLRKEMSIQLINMLTLHAIPKFYEDVIYFDILKSKHFFYEMNKILIHTVFNMDKYITSFYNDLSGFEYLISIRFYSIFNNPLLNRLLLNSFGIMFSNDIIINYITIIKEGEINFLIEEEEEEEEKEEELENLENLEELENLILLEETDVDIFQYINRYNLLISEKKIEKIEEIEEIEEIEDIEKEEEVEEIYNNDNYKNQNEEEENEEEENEEEENKEDTILIIKKKKKIEKILNRFMYIEKNINFLDK
jgi:hypothetical protein